MSLSEVSIEQQQSRSADDIRLLNEGNNSDVFQSTTENRSMRDKLMEIVRKGQKNVMLTLASGLPTLKFIAVCITVSLLIEEGALKHNTDHSGLPHILQKAEVFFVYIAMTIPLSGVTIVIGTLVFSYFPYFDKTHADFYVLFRGGILLMELSLWLACLTKFSFTLEENIAAQTYVLVEGYNLILLKSVIKKRFMLYPCPRPCAMMEMHTINTNLINELRPVPHLPPGAFGPSLI